MLPRVASRCVGLGRVGLCYGWVRLWLRCLAGKRKKKERELRCQALYCVVLCCGALEDKEDGNGGGGRVAECFAFVVCCVALLLS